jgi:uncharacterized protein (UPF0332 family)
MPDRLIRRLEREGRIRKQEAGYVQVEALLKDAILDLGEARRIQGIAERAIYLLTYNAMLKAGRALLLLNGYVPDDGAQHKTVVDLTSAILGEKFRDLTEQFERMRRKRNDLTYQGGTLLSKSESQNALSSAISFIQNILKKVKTQNPQLELKFD